jgi:hypothetical protein
VARGVKAEKYSRQWYEVMSFRLTVIAAMLLAPMRQPAVPTDHSFPFEQFQKLTKVFMVVPVWNYKKN